MNGQVFRRRAKEFARLADLASDRPGAAVARQLAVDAEATHLVALTRTLRELRIEAAPDPEFRDRLRRQLVTAASGQAPAPDSRDAAGREAVGPGRQPGRTTRAGSPRLAFLAGLAAALVLVTGLTLLASNRALPGDALYAFKRSGEHVELALVRNPQERGLRQLSFAQTRLAEIGQLIARGAGTPPGQHDRTGAGRGAPAATDSGLLTRALDDMDADTRAGAAQVTGYAVQQRSDQVLAALAGWTATQRTALQAMLSRLPDAARARAAVSLALLRDLSTRVVALRSDLGCACLDRAGRDLLGPKPCSPCQATPHRPVPQHTSTPPRPATTAGAPPPSEPAPGAPSAAQTTPPPSAAPPSTVPTPQTPTLPVPLPTIPAAPSTSASGPGADEDKGNPLCHVLRGILC